MVLTSFPDMDTGLTGSSRSWE